MKTYRKTSLKWSHVWSPVAGVVAITLSMSAAAWSAEPAAPAQPATVPSSSAGSAPAHRPSPIFLDLSTPKAAAKTLFNAISAGDQEAVSASLYAADESQRELAHTMAGLITSGKRLGDAANMRYGKAGDVIGRPMLDPADLARLESATVNQAGDAATLEVAGQPRPMSFRRQDGQWKLVIADFAGVRPENVAKQIQLVTMMSEAMDESAREISAGHYKTVEDATDAIRKKLHEVMLNLYHPATTRATTNPTTTPAHQ